MAELEDHPLDQYEFLGALVCRDALEMWLQIHGESDAWDATEEVDARFESVTADDDRFALHFAKQAGSGWWWGRLPADPAALDYIASDWDAAPPAAS